MCGGFNPPTTGSRSSTKWLTVVCWFCLLVFAGISAAYSTALEEIGQDFGLGFSRRGTLSMSRSVIFAFTAFGGGVLADRMRKTRLLAVAMLVTAAALLISAKAHRYSQLLGGMLIMGAGLGVVEGVLSPLVADLHARRLETHMNVLHGFYPVGLVAVSLLAGVAVRAGISWRTIILTLGGSSFAVALIFETSRSPTPLNTARKQVLAPRHILQKRTFWALSLVMVLTGGVEGAVTFWGPSFIRVEYDASVLLGASGMVVFALSMAIGRFGTGWVVRFVALERLMIFSCLVCMAATLCLALTPALGLSLVAIAHVGFSIACFWPGVLTLAARKVGAGSATLMAMLSVAGIAGFGLMPWLMGLVAERVGLAPGFSLLTVALVPVLTVLHAMVTRERRREEAAP
ncbi:MAG: MFS transporter [Kiritimatiellia bacterium]